MKRPENNEGTSLFSNTPAFTTIKNILSCLLFLKISGKVAVKSGSTAAEGGSKGVWVLGYWIVLDHTTC